MTAAIGLLEAAPPLGWSGRSHPGPVVVPYLLAAACGGVPGLDSPLLTEQFAAIDGVSDESERGLGRLLAERLASGPAGSGDRQRGLTAAKSVVEHRTAAIVEAKRRRAYGRVASLVVACAETLAAPPAATTAKVTPHQCSTPGKFCVRMVRWRLRVERPRESRSASA